MQLHTIEPAYLPNQRMCLQLDWLLTLKCNYDCSYCGLEGHDNRTKHPSSERCLQMLKYLYMYSDVVNKYKKVKSRQVVLNIYGGEAIYHPDIENILKRSTELYQPYKNRWQLKKRLTTNATSNTKSWKNICSHIDGCTISYHSEGPEKLKRNVKENILYCKREQMDYDVQILLNSDKKYWQDIMDFYQWCKNNSVKYHLKILDGPLSVYNKDQLTFIKKYFNTDIREGQRSRESGRACCGGKKLCFNKDLRNGSKFAPQPNSDYRGWHCSVNIFFLMANGVTGQFFSNKDCKVRDDGSQGPLANLDTMSNFIKEFDGKLNNGYSGVRCVQSSCACGICAPKSKELSNLKVILKHYLD